MRNLWSLAVSSPHRDGVCLKQWLMKGQSKVINMVLFHVAFFPFMFSKNNACSLKEIGERKGIKTMSHHSPFAHQCSCEFNGNKLGVYPWGREHFRVLNCGCPFSTVSPKLMCISPSEPFGVTLKILFFILHPPKVASIFPSHMQSVFAQLPPYWTATALPLIVVLKSWQWAQMSALGNVFVMLQFFISCFRTARMFLFAYVLVIMSQESSVWLFYIYFGGSHEFCYHAWLFIKTSLSSTASKQSGQLRITLSLSHTCTSGQAD